MKEGLPFRYVRRIGDKTHLLMSCMCPKRLAIAPVPGGVCGVCGNACLLPDEKHHTDRVRCLKCPLEFDSLNRKLNRICPKCAGRVTTKGGTRRIGCGASRHRGVNLHSQ